MALPLPWNWCYTPSQIDAAALMAASMRSQELQTRSQLRIKQKPRYLYDSAAWAYLLVGPARFELATNGLKVLFAQIDTTENTFKINHLQR